MKFKIHPYSIDTNERRNVFFYLTIISIIFAYFLYWSQNRFEYEIPWWIESPSVLGFYALILMLLDNYLWKWNLVRFLLSIKTPILEEKYMINLKTSYDAFKSPIEAIINIEQTYFKISINLETATSKSESKGAFFCLNDSSNPSLSYEFISKPNASAPETMNMHYGMGTIYLKNKKIEGEYFNGRGRQQYGEFKER